MNATAAARIESARAIIAAYTPAQRAACLALVEATTMGRYESVMAALLTTSAKKIKGTERYDLWTLTPSYVRAWHILSALCGSPDRIMDFPVDRQERGLRMVETLLRESVSVAA